MRTRSGRRAWPMALLACVVAAWSMAGSAAPLEPPPSATVAQATLGSPAAVPARPTGRTDEEVNAYLCSAAFICEPAASRTARQRLEAMLGELLGLAMTPGLSDSRFQARRNLEAAAESGNAVAQYFQGTLLKREQRLGPALRWLEDASRAGYGPATLELAQTRAIQAGDGDDDVVALHELALRQGVDTPKARNDLAAQLLYRGRPADCGRIAELRAAPDSAGAISDQFFHRVCAKAAGP